MTRRCILTIEDDPAIRQGIVDVLEYAGYEVLQAGDGTEGAHLAVHRQYDLLLLDLVLPGRGDWRSCSLCGRRVPTLPVIILTAHGAEQDRVEGLRKGADDYVVKPFSVKELLARVEAVMRRTPERPSDVECVPLVNGSIDLARREIRFQDGTRAELSEKEMELLRYLVRHRGLRHQPGRVIGERLANQSSRCFDADHRHAHCSPTRKAAGRSSCTACAADSAWQGVYVRHRAAPTRQTGQLKTSFQSVWSNRQ